MMRERTVTRHDAVALRCAGGVLKTTGPAQSCDFTPKSWASRSRGCWWPLIVDRQRHGIGQIATALIEGGFAMGPALTRRPGM